MWLQYTCTLVSVHAVTTMFEFIVCSAIQGHHVYKPIWDIPVNEELKCQSENRRFT